MLNRFESVPFSKRAAPLRAATGSSVLTCLPPPAVPLSSAQRAPALRREHVCFETEISPVQRSAHMSPAQRAACIMLRPTHQRKAFDNSRTRRLPRQNGPSRHSQYFQRSMPLLGAIPCALNAAPNVASKIAPKCKATTARHFK